MFLLSLHEALQDDPRTRDQLAEMLVEIGGFVLMATGGNGLIAAFDDRWLARFEGHPAIAACGAIHLDPNGAAADRLRHLFALNVATQLPRHQVGDAADARALHRPLRWRHATTPSPFADTGVTISTLPSRR